MAFSLRSAIVSRWSQLACSSRLAATTSIRSLSTSALRQQQQRLPSNMSTDLQKAVAQLNQTAVSSEEQEMINVNDEQHLHPGLARYRVIPATQSFYMSNPPHEENMRKLNDLLRANINLPTVARENTKAVSWVSFTDYANTAGGARLEPVQYKNLTKLLNRLSLIDPQLMPDSVWDALTPFIKAQASKSSSILNKTLDEFGRAVTIGRRKASTARLYMTNNTDEIKGQILVNGKPINEYFPRLVHRTELLYPLRVVEAVGDYNIFVTVQGGGSTGQSGAIALAIARALVVHNPGLKTRLHKAGCMTRDKRVVERKKPGKAKARKANAWVKR